MKIQDIKCSSYTLDEVIDMIKDSQDVDKTLLRWLLQLIELRKYYHHTRDAVSICDCNLLP